MAELNTCASCAALGQFLVRCHRCGTSYCSTVCQEAHEHVHKPSCQFTSNVPTQATAETPADSLLLLRTMPNPGTKQELPGTSPIAQRAFNISEIRIAVFHELPATDLLRTQRVCRSWYLTSALKLKLQQRLFFSSGPCELVVPSQNDIGVYRLKAYGVEFLLTCISRQIGSSSPPLQLNSAQSSQH
jgi:hypothetical protein